PQNGFRITLDDMHELTQLIKKENPKMDVYLLAHSFGSLMAQGYLALYGKEIKGLVLSGTAGHQPITKIGYYVASLFCLFKGREYRSNLLNNMSFGAFNNAFKPTRTDFDWLSRDNAEVDKYINDPWCGFVCTTGFFKDLAAGLGWIHSKETQKKIPANTPVFIVVGALDPVGGATENVKGLIRKYQELGLKDLTWKFYQGARHEILNETNRDEVAHDILEWIKAH
ncbi:MAG: alpha/beta fold hydrolase, partial [Spirochaetota bacterium]